MPLPPRRTAMARKRHKPEEIVAKLRQGDVLTSQGMPIADAIRSIGVTEVAPNAASSSVVRYSLVDLLPPHHGKPPPLNVVRRRNHCSPPTATDTLAGPRPLHFHSRLKNFDAIDPERASTDVQSDSMRDRRHPQHGLGQHVTGLHAISHGLGCAPQWHSFRRSPSFGVMRSDRPPSSGPTRMLV
jgi:hypothetical protein